VWDEKWGKPGKTKKGPGKKKIFFKREKK